MFRLRYVVLIVICLALFATACSSGATATPAPVRPTAPAAVAAATATTVPANTPAPSPTPQPTATAVPTVTPAPAQGAACLVMTTWQLSDMSAYFTGVMAQAGNGAKFVGQDGTITYVFGNDGVASVEADNFKLTLAVDMQGVALDIVVTITGRATANYTLSDPNKVTFSNAQTGNLKFSATLNGQELFAGTPDEMAAMFGVSPDPKYNTFTYECSGDTLKYTPPVKNAKPLTFKRVP
jgi:hypothetical protein